MSARTHLPSVWRAAGVLSASLAIGAGAAMGADYALGVTGAASTAVIFATSLAALIAGYYLFLHRGIEACRVSMGGEEVSSTIFLNSNEGILITDATARIIDVNPAFCTITGYSRDEILGQNPGIMKSGRHDRAFYDDMWGELREHGHWQGEIWDRKKDGEIYAKWLSITAVKDADGRTEKYIGAFSDITAMKQTDDYHEFLAHYDSLTHLPNRLLFNDRLDQALNHAARGNHKAAVMFLDLDRFKIVNDTMGHSAGDELLRAVSGRLTQCIRKEDTVARFGGDEFAIVLSNINSEKNAASVAEKIIASLKEPIRISHRDVRITTSIGITIFPYDGASREELLRNADIAMYQAKNHGRNSYRFFTEEMQKKILERLHVENNLRLALEKNELVLHYQPQLDLVTGKVVGVESLVRRQEDDWLVLPSRFIPIAEETGMIIQIGEWTLRESCRQAVLWIAEGLPPLRMSVNISAYHFAMLGFTDSVKKVLEETGLDPKLLEIEFTERVMMENAEEVIAKVEKLHEMGVHVSIDDFGTGYSSLSYLSRFKIDKLKIDYAFVKELPEGKNAQQIAKAIISLAHNLGLRVIAEGVEKREQLEYLKGEGCDEVQGFYYSFPLPAERFGDFVKNPPEL